MINRQHAHTFARAAREAIECKVRTPAPGYYETNISSFDLAERSRNKKNSKKITDDHDGMPSIPHDDEVDGRLFNANAVYESSLWMTWQLSNMPPYLRRCIEDWFKDSWLKTMIFCKKRIFFAWRKAWLHAKLERKREQERRLHRASIRAQRRQSELLERKKTLAMRKTSVLLEGISIDSIEELVEMSALTRKSTQTLRSLKKLLDEDEGTADIESRVFRHAGVDSIDGMSLMMKDLKESDRRIIEDAHSTMVRVRKTLSSMPCDRLRSSHIESGIDSPGSSEVSYDKLMDLLPAQ